MQPTNQGPELAKTLIDTRPNQPSGERPLGVESFGLTDRGRVRPANEDQFIIAALTGAMWIAQSSFEASHMRYGRDVGHLFVVADGMGGHAGGKEASALAVGSIERFTLRAIAWLLALGSETEVLREFQDALRRADAKVCDEAARRPELRGMGTTLTMAYNLGSELFIAHAGDSRCYLMRGGRLRLLTEDDTLVHEMVKGGVLKPEEVADHEFRHIVTNVVGGPNRGVVAAVQKLRLAPGDLLLLCTDGLTEMLPEQEITSILAGAADPSGAATALIARANELGGRDNITVIVSRYMAAE